MLICMFAGQTAASTTALARPAAARVEGTTNPTAHASSAMPDATTSGRSHRRSARGMIGVNTPGRTRWMTPDTANGTITIQGTVAAGFFARRVIPPFSRLADVRGRRAHSSGDSMDGCSPHNP